MTEPQKWQFNLGSQAQTRELIEQTPTGSGQFSIADCFPIMNEIPLSAGGVAPARVDANAIFQELGLNEYFKQHGGMYSYDASLAYKKGSLVLYECYFYNCIQDNEPSSQDTSPANPEYWVKIADLNDLLRSLGLKGIFQYRTSDNYTVGDLVYYQDDYFKCIQANGPDTAIQFPQEEGDDLYWELFHHGSTNGSDLVVIPLLVSPTNNSENNSTYTSFEFERIITYLPNLLVDGVQLQVALGTDADFSHPIIDVVTQSVTGYALSEPLDPNTAYVARIRTLTNYTMVYSRWSDVVYFETGASASIEAPTITCSDAVGMVGETPTFTLSALRVSDPTQTDTLKQSSAWLESNGQVIYTWASAQTLTFDTPSGILQTATNYTFKAQQTGNRFGNSPVASLNFTTKSVFAYIAQPSITSPVAGGEIIIPSGLTMQASAFQVVDGTDTHTASNWYLRKGNLDSSILILSAENSSDLLQHTFTSSELETAGVQGGDTLIPQVSFVGQDLGTSAISAPFVITALANPFANDVTVDWLGHTWTAKTGAVKGTTQGASASAKYWISKSNYSNGYYILTNENALLLAKKFIFVSPQVISSVSTGGGAAFGSGSSTTFTGATGYAVGTSKSNTDAIMNVTTGNAGSGSVIAARWCRKSGSYQGSNNPVAPVIFDGEETTGTADLPSPQTLYTIWQIRTSLPMVKNATAAINNWPTGPSSKSTARVWSSRYSNYSSSPLCYSVEGDGDFYAMSSTLLNGVIAVKELGYD